MPTYEYRCSVCRSEPWSERRHISQRHDASCDDCGAPAVLVPSLFSYNGMATHTEWSHVAPLDADGHLVSRGEAVKDPQYDKFDPMVPVKAAQKKAHDNEQHRAVAWEQSRREVWKERKVTIR